MNHDDHRPMGVASHADLKEEIQLIERRLERLGDLADSAYEKLLDRAYRDMLNEKRARLAAAG